MLVYMFLWHLEIDTSCNVILTNVNLKSCKLIKAKCSNSILSD